MKIGIIILSRYSSSRLPGKALLKINNNTTLDYIVERLEQIIKKDEIVIATSIEESDNKIAEFAKKKGINCFRGSLSNVSERFYLTGLEYNWDYLIRINGDNIFADIKVLQEMINIAKKGEFDFISNVPNRTFPRGMSVEIVKTKYYQKNLLEIYDSSYHSEHVMSYFYKYGKGNHYYLYNECLPEAKEMNLALDTKEDFDLVESIILEFEKEHWVYNLEEIYPIWKEKKYGKSI